MEKILVVLMIILFIMIGLLVLVTILSKRKKDGVQSKNDEVIEEIEKKVRNYYAKNDALEIGKAENE